MEKRGMIETKVSPCLVCGKPATQIIMGEAYCDSHAKNYKQASVEPHINEERSRLKREHT